MPSKMLTVTNAEAAFILIFGILHFAIPFFLPPNFIAETTLFGFIQIADLVIPGCIAVGISAILYYAIKNIIPGAVLAFLYAGGIVFHTVYLLGLFPSVLRVPTPVVSVGGIIIDAFSIIAIFDYYRRIRKR